MSLLQAETSGGGVVALRADPVTKSLISIDTVHAEVHAGEHFWLSGYAELDTNGTLIFTVTTPNSDLRAHMMFHFAGTDVTTIQVYEGAASVTGGSSATPLNSDRNSANASGLTVKKDPTVGTAGTVIDAYKFGSTGGGNAASAGGTATREDEIILKANTTYQFKVTSGADGNIVSYRGDWYEED